MIFQQVDEIVNGTKIQTRRIVKPGETCEVSVCVGVTSRRTPDNVQESDQIVRVFTQSGRLKWEHLRTYAVVQKRGKESLWWNPATSEYKTTAFIDYLERAKGFQPLRIKITAIRLERLGAITEADAKAEGCPPGEDFPIWWYMGLWDKINGKNSHEANPLVWVLVFEVVR